MPRAFALFALSLVIVETALAQDLTELADPAAARRQRLLEASAHADSAPAHCGSAVTEVRAVVRALRRARPGPVRDALDSYLLYARGGIDDCMGQRLEGASRPVVVPLTAAAIRAHRAAARGVSSSCGEPAQLLARALTAAAPARGVERRALEYVVMGLRSDLDRCVSPPAPERVRGNILFGDLVAERGEMAQPLLTRFIRTRASALRACYERELRTMPVAGRLRVRVVVGDPARPVPEITDDTMQVASLNTCIVRVLTPATLIEAAYTEPEAYVQAIQFAPAQ